MAVARPAFASRAPRTRRTKICSIIVNRLMVGSYFDVALRDLGLALGAFALARLSADYSEM